MKAGGARRTSHVARRASREGEERWGDGPGWEDGKMGRREKTGSPYWEGLGTTQSEVTV